MLLLEQNTANLGFLLAAEPSDRALERTALLERQTFPSRLLKTPRLSPSGVLAWSRVWV